MMAAVHPRRRGEHSMPAEVAKYGPGSSPQARGTHFFRYVADLLPRFIPAGAGNTRQGWTVGGGEPVHPRRRGEH